ncbi:MAG: hypothetical protein AAGJ85_08900, partial [Pseudomonadota bacterium]
MLTKRIFELEEKFMREGVEPHLRSYRVAQQLMADLGILSYRLDDPRVKEFLAAYGKLFPNAGKTGGWVGYGIAAVFDDVRKITVPYLLGKVAVHAHNLCGFDTHEQWAVWCRGDEQIATASAAAAFDALDFAYGVMDYSKPDPARDGSAFLETAKSNLEEISKSLPQSGNYQTLSQCI